jgi:hypothetical protein
MLGMTGQNLNEEDVQLSVELEDATQGALENDIYINKISS